MIMVFHFLLPIVKPRVNGKFNGLAIVNPRVISANLISDTHHDARKRVCLLSTQEK